MMKRASLVFAFLLIISALFGCSETVSPSYGATPQPTYSVFETIAVAPVTPGPTAQPVTASPAAETDTPEPSSTPEETASVLTKIYTSKGLGLTFTVPKSWVGKYRVEEEEGYLSVYFRPDEPISSGGDGELFTIMKGSCTNWDSFFSEWEFKINGIKCGWGTMWDSYYKVKEPEYNTYLKMLDDIPAIFHSLQSLSGKAPDHVETICMQVIPAKTEYTTTMGLSIKFKLPKRWIGNCRIEEYNDYLEVHYIQDSGEDAWLFGIAIKNARTAECEMPVDKEFRINGATYIWSEPTDMEFDNPDDLDAMQKLYPAIFKSIRAAK